MRYKVTEETVKYLKMEVEYHIAMRDGDYIKAEIIDGRLGSYALEFEHKIFEEVSERTLEL